MATHSSILAWEIPWTEEPGGLKSMGSQKSRHNLVTKQQQQMCVCVCVCVCVKNLPAMQEIQVRSLSWEDPLERQMATHSSILI